MPLRSFKGRLAGMCSGAKSYMFGKGHVCNNPHELSNSPSIDMQSELTTGFCAEIKV